MSSDTPHGDDGNKAAIARQVIVSAGDILVAAGFGRDEIAAFFRQAADHLGGALQAGPADASSRGGEDILSRYRAIAPVRALAGLTAEAAALASAAHGGEALKDAYDLAMKIIPHIAEAQGWLRAAAREAGLRISADSRERPDGRADGEDLLMGEFEFAYRDGFDLIASVVAVLAGQDDEEAFRLILMSLVENGITVSGELKSAIETAAGKLAEKGGGK
ncbi:MAG: hypothetical protein WCY29_00570 [Novosphingobium sp.]